MNPSVNILYFASISEAVGIENETIELANDGLSLGQLKRDLAARGPEWEKVMYSPTLQCALNQTLSTDTTQICGGDEIAFFPPVTGG